MPDSSLFNECRFHEDYVLACVAEDGLDKSFCAKGCHLDMFSRLGGGIVV
jgi:hypothetical protein